MIVDGSASGHLAGTQLQPREIAALAYTAGPGWRDLPTLTMAVAVCLGESQGYEGAYNDNIDDQTGKVASRDVGLWEVNIPASEIGTGAEKVLYNPNANVSAAYAVWKAGGWERWASYTSGVVFRDYYAARACLGVFNFAASELNGQGATLPIPIFTLAELHAKVKW